MALSAALQRTEFSMAECKKCGVKIKDDTQICPFCRCILEDDGTKGENIYPDAENVAKIWKMIRRIVSFASVCAIVGLCIALYSGADIFDWSLVIGLILIYANFSLYMLTTGRIGYMSKTLFLTVMGILFLIGIDYFTGYNRWSYDYTLPSGVIMLNVICVLLMFINKRNWQSYLSLQIFNLLCSLILVLLIRFDVIREKVLVIIAVSLSVILFAGMIIFGGRRATDELKRRLHI